MKDTEELRAQLDRSARSGLIARLEAYSLDQPDDAVPFSLRLRRRYRWSATSAARAIREYKRFVALALTLPQGATPSPRVDDVWREHLLDTRRYWEEFCPLILGRPLHHEPSQGGVADAWRFRDRYKATLEGYAQMFGEAPPRTFWPEPKNDMPVCASRYLHSLFHLALVLGAAVMAG